MDGFGIFADIGVNLEGAEKFILEGEVVPALREDAVSSGAFIWGFESAPVDGGHEGCDDQEKKYAMAWLAKPLGDFWDHKRE